MHARQRWLMGMVIGCAVWVAAPHMARAEGRAAQCPVCAKASDHTTSYPSKAAHTLCRGAANTLFGWTELLREPVDEAKAGGNVLTGIANGLGQSVRRTLAGAGEVLTFWTPKTRSGYLHFADDCPICRKHP